MFGYLLCRNDLNFEQTIHPVVVDGIRNEPVLDHLGFHVSGLHSKGDAMSGILKRRKGVLIEIAFARFASAENAKVK